MVGHGPCVQTMDSFSRNKRPARDWGTAGSDYGRLYYQRALHLRHGDFMALKATEIMRRRCCAGSTCSLRFHKLGAGDRPSRDVIAGLSIPLRYLYRSASLSSVFCYLYVCILRITLSNPDCTYQTSLNYADTSVKLLSQPSCYCLSNRQDH